LCEKYNTLSHRERIDYIGKLLHSVQSDNQLYIIGQAIIRQAENNGILDDVVINPQVDQSRHDESDISEIS
jgi:hypothetical protein